MKDNEYYDAYYYDPLVLVNLRFNFKKFILHGCLDSQNLVRLFGDISQLTLLFINLSRKVLLLLIHRLSQCCNRGLYAVKGFCLFSVIFVNTVRQIG